MTDSEAQVIMDKFLEEGHKTIEEFPRVEGIIIEEHDYKVRRIPTKSSIGDGKIFDKYSAGWGEESNHAGISVASMMLTGDFSVGSGFNSTKMAVLWRHCYNERYIDLGDMLR